MFDDDEVIREYTLGEGTARSELLAFHREERFPRVEQRQRLPGGVVVLPEIPTVRVHPAARHGRTGKLRGRRGSVEGLPLKLNRALGQKPRFHDLPLVLAEQAQWGCQHAGPDEVSQVRFVGLLLSWWSLLPVLLHASLPP